MVFVDFNVILDVITADPVGRRGAMSSRDRRRFRRAFTGLELIAPSPA